MLVGELYCHGCWAKTMHETEHDDAPDPLTLPIVCTACGKVTKSALREFDPATGLPYRDGPVHVPGFPRGVLENARADLRGRWDMDMLRAGVPVEILTQKHRRGE
jgi:hypothetical protein